MHTRATAMALVARRCSFCTRRRRRSRDQREPHASRDQYQRACSLCSARGSRPSVLCVSCVFAQNTDATPPRARLELRAPPATFQFDAGGPRAVSCVVCYVSRVFVRSVRLVFAFVLARFDKHYTKYHIVYRRIVCVPVRDFASQIARHVQCRRRRAATY